MTLTGRFWGGDRETLAIDKSSWQAEPANEDDLRNYLKAFEHPVSDFDVLPKIIFNFPVPPE